MKDKQRKTARPQRGQLLTLLNGWDPAGLLAAGAARDKYDWLVDKLLAFLSQNPNKEDVAAFLEREMSEHFGTRVSDASHFAAKAVAWFQMIPSEKN